MWSQRPIWRAAAAAGACGRIAHTVEGDRQSESEFDHGRSSGPRWGQALGAVTRQMFGAAVKAVDEYIAKFERYCFVVLSSVRVIRFSGGTWRLASTMVTTVERHVEEN